MDPFGRRITKAAYYEEDFIIGEVALESVRRKRTMASLLRDEDLDLTINELLRIRERTDSRERQKAKVKRQKGKGKGKSKRQK